MDSRSDLDLNGSVPNKSMVAHLRRLFRSRGCRWWAHVFYAVELSTYMACLFLPNEGYIKQLKILAAIHFGTYVLEHLRVAYRMRRYRCTEEQAIDEGPVSKSE
jgi:hypothetical protein